MPDLPPPLPALPDATWRPLTLDDVPAYVRLMEAARVADGDEEVQTEEVVRHEFEDPQMPVATNSTGLFGTDGTLLGYAAIMERLAGEGARRAFAWGRTDPAVRGLGIGTAALSWAVARADEILAMQPADVPRFTDGFANVQRTDAVALFEEHGFAPVRWYFTMRRVFDTPLPEPVDTEGVRIVRYAEAPQAGLAERVRRTHNESFTDHWGSEPIPAEDWNRNFVGDPFFRPDLSLVVLDGDEVVAYSTNYVAEPDWVATGVREGWVGQLGVRRAWRRRGLATALLVRSMEIFAAAGLEAATLDVDAENPTGAVGIYERVGFRPIRRHVRLRRPFAG